MAERTTERTPGAGDGTGRASAGPEAGGPEAGGPDAGGAEGRGPEIGGPEVGGPEGRGPEVGGPEGRGPEAGGAEAAWARARFVAPGPVARTLWGLRAYCFIVAMWVRSALAYRASFALLALGSFVTTFLDFVAIMIMFSHIEVLGGFSLPEVAFLYGVACTAFGIADMLLGSFDRIGSRVRDGTLDALLVRPVPVLAQAAADRFALRRLGRITQSGLVLGWALTRLDVDWSAGKLLMLPVMLLSGAAIFCALFVLGGAVQFWTQDTAEVQNSFTYGGVTLLQYPPTVFATDLVRGVTFIVPLAFVNWLPALRILGRDDPLGLPGWLDFAPPLVAAVCCAVAGLVWRAGLRAYRSTGS